MRDVFMAAIGFFSFPLVVGFLYAAYRGVLAIREDALPFRR